MASKSGAGTGPKGAAEEPEPEPGESSYSATSSTTTAAAAAAAARVPQMRGHVSSAPAPAAAATATTATAAATQGGCTILARVLRCGCRPAARVHHSRAAAESVLLGRGCLTLLRTSAITKGETIRHALCSAPGPRWLLG